MGHYHELSYVGEIDEEKRRHMLYVRGHLE